jgi:uncharacterized protein (TIGR00369 family)
MSNRNGFPVDIPFVAHLGFELRECADGRALVVFATQAEHLNSWGVVHGGVVMTLLDVAMASAGRSLRNDIGHGGNVTIEMKTSFLRPARGVLQAKGACLHTTSTMSFCEAEVFGDDGELAAKASGTFKYLRSRETK